MLRASTTLYLLALLCSQPAFTAALVQIEPGLAPRLPRGRFSAEKRSLDIPTLIRGAEEISLGLSYRSGERAAVEARQDADGRVTSGRQTLGTVAGTYTIPVIIGTPPNAFPLQLDLASSDILLASTLCTTESCPASRGENVNPYYGFTSSSTLANVTDTSGQSVSWNTRYADGTTASGFAVRETVEVAGVIAEDVPFGVINATNITLSEQRISGIFGLAFPRLSTLARASLRDDPSPSSSPAAPTSSSRYLPPVLETLTTNPYLQYPIFALALNQSNPSLTIGGVSTNYTSPSNSTDGRRVEDIDWVQVVPFGPALNVTRAKSLAPTRISSGSSSSTGSASSSSPSASSMSSSVAQQKKKRTEPTSLAQLEGEAYLYWAVQLRNISMNGTDVPLSSSYADIGLGSIALLDIGTNGLYGPAQDVISIFSTIRDSRQVSEGQWAVPCETEMTMGFSFGGRYITLQPSEWMSGRVANTQMCLAWPVALPETGDGLDWQLGTPFLKKVYSIYSYGINNVQAPLVGFLPMPTRAPSTSPTSSTMTTSASISASSTIDANSPIPTSVEDASQIASHLTVTFATQLPNVLLPDPTYTTPPYLFSSAPLISAGALQTLGLGNDSAYTVMPPPTVSVPSINSSATSRTIGGVGSSTPESGATTLEPQGWLALLLTVGTAVFLVS